MNKKVLMIAFHFPPNSSIGAQRTFKTAEYLPEFGWDPIILTAKPNAYDAIEETQQIPQQLLDKTYRTIALDVQNHLSIKGKHFEWMKIIDRWSSWIPGAILQGKKIINEHEPDLIWSTSPIPSAHIIAKRLSTQHSIPWVADYRDPLSYHHYPTPKLKAKFLKKIDQMTMDHCKAAVFTTTNAMDLYKNAFQEKNSELFFTVENGFDEENWGRVKNHKPTSINPLNDKKFSLFYSGVLYPNGRDPSPLFQALNILKHRHQLKETKLELIFQGAGNGEQYKELLMQLEITEFVKFTPSVPYLDSLFYMKQADALILIQDQIFNLQIPGKLYEYFRAGKPVLAITPDHSATAETTRQYKLGAIAQTSEKIADKIISWFRDTAEQVSIENIKTFSRKHKTAEIAKIFNKATD